jgi:hypothetical protein
LEAQSGADEYDEAEPALAWHLLVFVACANRSGLDALG